MLDTKFNPKDAEPRLYKAWEDSGAFKPRAAKEGDTKDDNFSIVIPPPNVTGSLHMGHAVNNTIQDILVRYNRMRGKAVLWQPAQTMRASPRKWWLNVNLRRKAKPAKI